MRQHTVEMLPTFRDHRRQTDNLGTCADNDQQFELAVAGKLYVRIVEFDCIH